LEYVEHQFLAAIGDRPYYRLTATPIPVNRLNLRERRLEWVSLLRQPPTLRRSGWDVTPVGDFQRTAIGLICTREDFRHLRLLWNGHVEFWTAVDDISFYWDEQHVKADKHVFLFPYAIIEPPVVFALLASKLCDAGQYRGQVRFGLGLYNIRDKYLAPYAPQSFAYGEAKMWMNQPGGPQPYGSDHLCVAPVTVQTTDLPDEVAWNLVKQVYYRFGYADEHVPLFDAEHHCVLGQKQAQGGAGTR
jgi:hypothetical protein